MSFYSDYFFNHVAPPFFLQISKEQIDVTPKESIELAAGQINLFVALILGLGGITSSVVAVGLWLRKQVTKDVIDVKKKTSERLDMQDRKTKEEIEDNKKQIKDAKEELGEKLDSNTQLISTKMAFHESLYKDIRTSLENINNKLDANIQGYARNKTRLDSHDSQLDRLQNRLDNSSSSPVRQNRNHYRYKDEKENNGDDDNN